MRRRLIVLLCMLLVCLGLLPATAWAAEPVTYLTWSEKDGKLVEATCDSFTSCSSKMSSTLGIADQTKWYVFKGSYTQRFRIEVRGDVHLILSDNCTLTAQEGIHVPDGSSLTIYAQSEHESEMGKLVAEPGDEYLNYHWGAVIGGNGNGTDTAGSITINGGNITATGKVSSNGAYGAAIGTGCYSTSGSTDSTMEITINGGIVTAEASGGGAAIGTGRVGNGGTITINGGTINATSNGDGAAIGTGRVGNGGTVTINGGTVQATSNSSGAAIGVGDSGTLGTVNITGGQITAAAHNKKGNPSNSGAAIGCGYFYKTGGEISISGGTVNITDGYQNGIGYGHLMLSTSGSSSISINITGGSICNPYQIGGAPVNGSGALVYKTTVDLSGVGGIAADQAVSGTIKDYSYGFDDVYPDANTCLYLYLPAGDTTATFGGQTFEGTVSAGDGNVLTASNAAKYPVSYIDKTGVEYTTKYYTVVTEDTSAWTTGWYVVSKDTTISGRIEVTGNVSLILTDGATLIASAGIHVPETASLDICGQSGGTGKLKANAGEGNAAIGGDGGEKETTGTISICSGTVEATGGSSGGAGIGGGANSYNGTDTCGTVAIYGGTITATGGNGGAGIGTGVDGQINNIILAGGTIEANDGGDSAQDIGLGGGTSTLDGVMEFDAGHGGVEEDGGEPVLQSVSGSETNHRYDLDIRGGSIYTSGGTEAVTAPDPYNSNYGGLAVKNKIVCYAVADFGEDYANKPVSGTITVGDSNYQYSFNGVKTDAKGKLHLYTFGGEVVLTADNGSTFEGTIAAANSALTPQQQPLGGSISIEGTAQCGEMLTVNTNSVTPDGAAGALSYTWYRCTSSDGKEATPISGATESTYTLTGDDADKYIKVVVASTDYSGTLSAVTTSTVQKIPATVSTAPVANDNLVYTGSAQALVTQGSAEGGTMMYRLGESGSFSDQIPTAINADSYSVWYKVSGDDNHSDTNPAEVMVTISQASIDKAEVILDDSNFTYDGSQQKPTVTVKLNDKELSAATDYTVTYSGDSKDAGTYTVTVTGTGNYTGTAASQTYTIVPATLTVTAANHSKTYGEDDPELTYQTSGLIGSDALTGELSRAEGENAGEYAITRGTLAAGDNYTIDFTGAKFTITPAAITVTADAKTKTYGDEDPALTYTVTGLKGEDKLTGALARTAGENVGEYDITQGNLANPNYTITFTEGAKFTINPKPVILAWGDTIFTYDGTEKCPTATASNKANADDDVTVIVSGGQINAGTAYTATADGLTGTAAGNYTLNGDQNTSQQFIINKATVTVAAPSKTIYVGDAIPDPLSLEPDVTGLVGEDALTGVVLTYESSPDSSTAGSYDIVPTGGSFISGNADNYTVSYVNGTLTVASRPAPTPDPTFPVDVHEAEGGSVDLDRPEARPGDPVTVTPRPDEGREVAEVVVTDAAGNPVDVVRNDDGTFTFDMPEGGATVTATFHCDGGGLCPSHGMADVVVGEWYHDAVDYVVTSGLMTGYADSGLFGPADSLGREQAAEVLYRALGGGAQAPGCGLADVDQSAWYAAAVDWAVSCGAMTGYADGSGLFGVGDALTREQFAAIVARVAGADLSGADLSVLDGFSDGDGVAGWAAPAMSWAVQAGVLEGSPDGDGGAELRAGAEINRAEMAAMVMRAAGAGLLPTAA